MGKSMKHLKITWMIWGYSPKLMETYYMFYESCGKEWCAILRYAKSKSRSDRVSPLMVQQISDHVKCEYEYLLVKCKYEKVSSFMSLVAAIISTCSEKRAIREHPL